MLKTNFYTNITRGFQDSFRYKKKGVLYYNIKGRGIWNTSEILISSNFHNVIRGDNEFGAKPKSFHKTSAGALHTASLPVCRAIHLFINSFPFISLSLSVFVFAFSFVLHIPLFPYYLTFLIFRKKSRLVRSPFCLSAFIFVL